MFPYDLLFYVRNPLKLCFLCVSCEKFFLIIKHFPYKHYPDIFIRRNVRREKILSGL